MVLSLPKRVRLVPKTRHGQNVVKTHGEEWTIVEDRGNELVLQSVNKTWGPLNNKSHDIRRVEKSDDADFSIETVECTTQT